MAPLAGPPERALKEANAIMKPMRRPMWPMSGVVCATQADPRGMRPPEKRPKRTAKAIMPLSVVMAPQQKVITAVKTPIKNKTLNLRVVGVSWIREMPGAVPLRSGRTRGQVGTYRPKRSAIQPLPTRPTTDPAYPIARRLLAMVEPTPCSMANRGM